MGILLEDVAAILQGGGVATGGTDLFAGDQPPTPDVIFAIHEYPGLPPIETGGPDSDPAVIRPRIQLVARGAAYDVLGPRGKAYAAYKLLTRITNEVVGGTLYQRIAPLQEPFLLNRDEQERVLYAFNADVWKAPEP